ncbi:SH3 domain-containing protein [Campylobacter sp. CCS1377]|uniref:SH3 domain-containing protein n=1 Tax=Campylobacter sp. CCS1377 TaxID=3158229 RepID=A0AAU7E5E7_9BACT
MKYFFLFIICIFLTSCSNKKLTSNYLDFKYQQDINILPALDKNQTFSLNNYKKNFFSPWHMKITHKNPEQIFWSFNFYMNTQKEFYFFNKQKIPKTWFEKQITNANAKDFLKINKKALVIKNSLLKNLPVDTPILLDPFKQGEGIPFDYAQDSVLNIASAILVSHYTLDKRFVFVNTESGWGFIPAQNIEFFSDKRAKIYENLNFITPLKDKFPIYDKDDNFIFQTRIGALYPYYSEDKNFYFGKIGSLKFKFPKSKAVKFPLEFNENNLKSQLTQLLALPYGWGGYNYERDCSLFLRDVFAPFGLYMPRNSKAQSEYFTQFNISKLSNQQKQIFLKKYAKTYLTLLYMKGHIMLYAGTINDDILALHSAWGVKTKDDGRLLIAKNAITTLDIASDKKEVDSKDLFISRLSAVSFLSLSQEEKEEISNYLQNINSH